MFNARCVSILSFSSMVAPLLVGLFASTDVVAQEVDSASGQVDPDPRGTWRLDLTVVTHAKVPVLGTTTARARTTFVVQIDGEPGSAMVKTDPCRLRILSDRSFATTRIPPAFEAALKGKQAALEGGPPTAGSPVRIDLRPQHMGYNPSIRSSVPEQADDPAVIDFERDGNPGGTIILDAPLFGETEIYVVQRAHSILEGEWKSADLALGRATIRDYAQRSVGASNRLFATNPDIKPDSTASTWRMVRIEEGATCADLARGAGAPSDDREYGS